MPQSAWDALATNLATPFLEWEWLRQLEISGSTTANTGWLPRHLTVWSDGQLVAAAPLYVKGHSAGEFVFDHAWADLATRLGTNYYPKLVGMSPFTPVVGYRFLIAPGEDEEYLAEIIVAEIDRFCRRYGLSGCSFLFVEPHWQKRMSRLDFSSWQHPSFAWFNQGYQTFEDYLSIFNANQRRNIKRERNALAQQGITLKLFTGDEIPPSLIPLMSAYYERTNAKFGPWGCQYLTPDFFEGVYRRYRHRLALIAAFDGSDGKQPLGLSFFVNKKNQLYGRYWGCSKFINALHFNACYYRPIEWSIARGIDRFDPGAGGPHKLRRGFQAVSNYSLHRFSDPHLRRIMQAHIGEINRLEQEQIDALNSQLPFASTQSGLMGRWKETDPPNIDA
ncbi:MAG: N-acetyltransferase [Desulfobacterales bacterium]|nr:MAG: N-acetyltransferase [Desulfobacterales bacterium]